MKGKKAKSAKGYGGYAGKLRSLLTFKPLVYGYSNARVRAMRTSLFSRRQAEDLLRMNTNAAVAEYISSRTGYREDFANMPMKITDEERVELAVSRNFSRTAQKLLQITPEQSRNTLFAFLGRYDIHNLKTILLAKKLGKSKEETSHLFVPAGNLGLPELQGMLNAKSSDELYEAVRASGFGSEFLSSASIRHLPRAQIKAVLQNPDSDLARLEILISALDSYYYEAASSSVQPGERDAAIIMNLLRSETDAKNAITAMRLKRAGADRKTIMASMVDGGNFTKIQLEKMAGSKSLEELVPLASSFFISETGKAEFAAAEQKYKSDGKLSHFEVVFEISLARRSLRTLRRSMMSIGAIVGFLFLKEEEMNNIRKIVRGKALGLPNERIAEMLVLVG